MAALFMNVAIIEIVDGKTVRVDPLYEFIGFSGSISLPMMIYILPGYFYYKARRN